MASKRGRWKILATSEFWASRSVCIVFYAVLFVFGVFYNYSRNVSWIEAVIASVVLLIVFCVDAWAVSCRRQADHRPDDPNP